MEKEQALILSKCMENAKTTTYELKKLVTVEGTLPKFHQWTNRKHTLAGYEVTRMESDASFYFLFIDWHRNDNYYLVIYAHDKSTTLAEIRQVQDKEGIPHLIWTYKPFKRDGKNDQRKAYFKQMFGTTTLEIKLPSSPSEVEDFFTQLFKLCQNRKKADKVVEVYDFDN